MRDWERGTRFPFYAEKNPAAKLDVMSARSNGIENELVTPRCVFRQQGFDINCKTESIPGGLSLIFWTIMALVTLKYVAIIMRADNRGEQL